MTHPEPFEIIQQLHRAGAVGGQPWAHHVSHCPSCAAEVEQVEAVRRTLRSGATDGRPGPECLDDDLLGALADGSLDAGATDDGLRHLASCAHCRRVVASLAAALDDPSVLAAAERGSRTARRWSRFVIPVAAAAALAITVLGRYAGGDGPSVMHRAPAVTPLIRPEAISPVGVGDHVEQVRWRTVPGAELYRVTLFQADGSALYEIETRDTTVALPDSLRLMRGSSYFWRVEARTGWNRWSASRLFEFSVRAAP